MWHEIYERQQLIEITQIGHWNYCVMQVFYYAKNILIHKTVSGKDFSSKKTKSCIVIRWKLTLPMITYVFLIYLYSWWIKWKIALSATFNARSSEFCTFFMNKYSPKQLNKQFEFSSFLKIFDALEIFYKWAFIKW